MLGLACCKVFQKKTAEVRDSTATRKREWALKAHADNKALHKHVFLLEAEPLQRGPTGFESSLRPVLVNSLHRNMLLKQERGVMMFLHC